MMLTSTQSWGQEVFGSPSLFWDIAFQVMWDVVSDF